MRSIITGLRAYLAAAVASAGAPIYIGRAEQNTAIPFIVLQRLNAENYQTMDDTGDDSLRAETFRITTYAHTDLPAHTIADAIAEDLDDYTGAMGSDRVCRAAYLDDESGDYEPPEFVDALAIADLVVTIQHSPAA